MGSEGKISGRSIAWFGKAICDTSKKAIRRAFSELEAAGFIKVDRQRRKINRYTVRFCPAKGPQVYIGADVLSLPIPPAAALLLAEIRHRGRKNGECWPTLKELAESLGLSLVTTNKYVKLLQLLHYIQVRARGGGWRRQNCYRITNRLSMEYMFPAEKALLFEPKPDKTYRIQEGDSFYKTPSEDSSFQGKFPCEVLSSRKAEQVQVANLLEQTGLAWHGIDEVIDRLHSSPESVRQMVMNTRALMTHLRRSDPFRARCFNTAGYVLGGLRAAHCRGRKITCGRWRALEYRCEAAKAARQKVKALPAAQQERFYQEQSTRRDVMIAALFAREREVQARRTGLAG